GFRWLLRREPDYCWTSSAQRLRLGSPLLPGDLTKTRARPMIVQRQASRSLLGALAWGAWHSVPALCPSEEHACSTQLRFSSTPSATNSGKATAACTGG